MADALTIVDIPSYDASKESSASKIKTEAPAGSASIPPGWLEFYTSIMKSVKEYQAALERKNYAELAKFDIVISQKIADYIEKNASKGESSSNNKKDSEENIEKILKAATDVNISTFKNSIDEMSLTGLKTEEEIVTGIESAISNYKNKIQEILDSNFSYLKSIVNAVKQDFLSKDKKTDLIEENIVVENTLAAVNGEIEKRTEPYHNAISSFSLLLGFKLFDLFKNSANIFAIGKKISKTVSGNRVINANNVFSNQNQVSSSEILDLSSNDVEKQTNGFFRRKFIPVVKSTLKWTAAIIIASLWRLSIYFLKHLKDITKSLLKFVFVDFWKILGRLKDRIVSGIKSIFSISKKIYDIVFKNSFAKILYAFFRSYPGAYALGWMFGSIWYVVKKRLGVENFVELKEKFSTKISESAEKLKEQIEKLPTIEKIVEAFKKTTFYRAAVAVIHTISWVYDKVKPLFQKWIIPAIASIGSFLSIFVGRELQSLGIYSRTKVGVFASFSHIEKAGRKIAGKGGIAALLAGAAIIGSAFAAFSYEQKKIKELEAIRKDNSLKEFQVNTSGILKEAFAGTDILHGGINSTEGIARRMVGKNKNPALLSTARELLNISDGIEEEFIEYNDHVKILEDLLVAKKSGQNIVISAEDRIPIELRNKIFSFNGKMFANSSLIEKFGRLPLREQLMFLSETLKYKRYFIAAKLKDFYAKASKNEFSDNNEFLTFRDSIYEPDFSRVSINVANEISRMPGGFLEGVDSARLTELYKEKARIEGEIKAGRAKDIAVTIEGFDKSLTSEEYLAKIKSEIDERSVAYGRVTRTNNLTGNREYVGGYVSDEGDMAREIFFVQAKYEIALKNILRILKASAIERIAKIIGISSISQTKQKNIISAFDEFLTNKMEEKVKQDIETSYLQKPTLGDLDNAAYTIFQESFKEAIEKIKTDFEIGELIDSQIEDASDFAYEIKEENEEKIKKEIYKYFGDLETKLTAIQLFFQNRIQEQEKR